MNQRRAVTMIETLAAAMLVAMMAVALVHTAMIVRASHQKAAQDAERVERTLVALRQRAVAARERVAMGGHGAGDVTVVESSLQLGLLAAEQSGGWVVVSENGVGLAVWMARRREGP